MSLNDDDGDGYRYISIIKRIYYDKYNPITGIEVTQAASNVCEKDCESPSTYRFITIAETAIRKDYCDEYGRNSDVCLETINKYITCMEDAYAGFSKVKDSCSKTVDTCIYIIKFIKAKIAKIEAVCIKAINSAESSCLNADQSEIIRIEAFCNSGITTGMHRIEAYKDEIIRTKSDIAKSNAICSIALDRCKRRIKWSKANIINAEVVYTDNSKAIDARYPDILGLA